MKFKALICLVCLYYRISLAFSPRLLYANRRDIRIVRPNNKSQNETIIVDGLDDAIAVDFCFAEGFVFWTDVSLEKIKRISVTTKKIEDVISVGLKKPEGLAVDWVARKLYWTDCRDSEWEANRIEVANLDGSNRKVLFWKNLGLPRAIAVDPLLGYMFWTDWGEEPKIERAEMDSSNRRVIIRQDIHWPNGLTIDYTTQKIYWTDAKLYYIAKANYDGSNRERIFKSPSQCVLGHPFALTLYDNKIYWTDWKTRGIHSTNKNTGQRCQRVWSDTYSPMDIHAYEPKRQKPRSVGNNPCNSTTNGGCSHLCLLNFHGHSCACPTGVKLLSDGKTCEQGPVHFLLLARKVDVRRISLDTPDLTDIVVPVSGIRHAVAIDFDPVDKFVYWSDDENLEIKRARMDGTDVQVVVAIDVRHPDGVAVDWVARNLYWTDTGTDRIEVSRLNGSSRKVLISEDLEEPRAITLDPTNGYMYWTDWGKHPKIERAGLDGSQRVILVNTSVVWPNGITIDYHNKQIYWADAKLDKIEVMNLDGSNRRSVLDDKLPHVFGFTVLGDRLFWTDWQRRAIESFNKETVSERITIIEGLPDLMGLKAVDLNLTYGSNPCQHNNGGCSHLCLYRPLGVRCECPEGMELLANKKNCILPEAFLLFSIPDDIKRISLDTNNGVVIPLVGAKDANALDFSVHDMQIYWTDGSRVPKISRAFLNGSHTEHLIVVDVGIPDGLAVEWIAKNLYWTDSKHQRIEVSRLNGQHRKMLIWKDLWEPRELTLDPVAGYMYWANGGNDPKIERAHLDGSNRHTVVSNITRPTGLTIDFSLELIFWVDVENKVIECANLNGTNRRTVASELPKPFALTLFKDYIYWADWKQSSIYRANKTNGLERTSIKGNIDFIMDILVFHSSRQEGRNPCSVNNGECSHLCLAKPDNRMVCSCPTHFTLSKTDNKTCSAPRVFLLYSTMTEIRRILFNSSDNLDVVLPVRDLTDVLAIDYDINSNLIFWIDAKTKHIRCAFQNGTNAKAVVLSNDASPYDLAIDSYGQQLFWTDSATNTINIYSFRNRTNIGVVFKEDNVYPRSIVLHPEKGQMFFTNENPEKNSIMRATMGGADSLNLFSAESPGDLAVDKKGKKLFWTDTKLKKIEYGDLTGKNRATLVEMNVLHPVGLVVHGDYVYWIDRESRNVVKIKKEDEDHGSTVQAAIDDLSDMIVVDTMKTTAHHPCFANRCSHICLVGLHGKAQCSCPMNMILGEDNSTCRDPKRCRPDQFTCSNGHCINKNWYCDDSDDCKDNSDEENCTKCPEGELRCNGGKCISVEKLCDGKDDCKDSWDEKSENCPLNCSEDQFGCVDSRGIVILCISKDWVCDRHKDCVDNSDEIDCDAPQGNSTIPNVTAFNHSNLSGKMVGVIVASIIVCVIFLTVAVLMCRRFKHGPDCNVAHEIGLVVTPVLHPRPGSSASSSSSSTHHDIFVLAPLRKGPESAGSSNKRTKSNGTVPSLSNRSSTTQTVYDRNNLTGASCSSTASTVVTAYLHEPLNPPPSPVTERSQFISRSHGPYCESLISPSSCTSHRCHRPRMPPPPTPASTDVESVISRHRCRRPHRCRYQRYTPSSCTDLAYDSDLFAPPPTPNTNYLSEGTHMSDQEGPPPSPAMTERSYHPHPYPPPPSPVTDAPSVVL